MTHICVSKVTIIGSDNGLWPGWRQAHIWTNAGKLLIGHFQINALESAICAMAVILSQPQCGFIQSIPFKTWSWSSKILWEKTAHSLDWGMECPLWFYSLRDILHFMLYMIRRHGNVILIKFSLLVSPEFVIFTRGQFWPSGIVVACVCLSVCPSVHLCVR